jgi:hypothetical protein
MSTTFLNYFMYIPREGSRRERFIEIINEAGNITVEKLVKKHGMMGFANTWDITIELRKLARLKCIKMQGDVFFPAFRDRPALINDEVNLVQPREPVPFKPLQTFPRTVSPRGQVIERRTFKTCKSNVRYKRENDI